MKIIQKYNRNILFNLNHKSILLVDIDLNRKSNHFAMVDKGLFSISAEIMQNVQCKYHTTIINYQSSIKVDPFIKAFAYNLKALGSKRSIREVETAKTKTKIQLLLKSYNTLGQNGGMKNEL